MTIATDTRIEARMGAAAAVLSDCRGEGDECLLVFGGLAATGTVQSTDVLTTGAGTVQWVNPAGAKVGDIPPGLMSSVMVPDPTGRVAVMFGGKTSSSDDTATDALYAINTAGWQDQTLLGNIGRARPVYHTKPRTEARFHKSNAVDGLTSSVGTSGQCALGNGRADNPTISVDLGGPRTVAELEIWPRTDVNWDASRDVRFVVNDHESDPLDKSGNWHECVNPTNGRLRRPTVISCGGVTGRYVHYFKRGSHQLDVCEINVMGP